MRRLNDFAFFDLGQRLAPISDLSVSTPYKDCYLNLWFARAGLNDFLKTTPELTICRVPAQNLIKAISDMVPQRWADASSHDMDELIESNNWHIREAKEVFEHVLAAELNSAGTYLITKQGIYDTGDLVENQITPSVSQYARL